MIKALFDDDEEDEAAPAAPRSVGRKRLKDAAAEYLDQYTPNTSIHDKKSAAVKTLLEFCEAKGILFVEQLTRALMSSHRHHLSRESSQKTGNIRTVRGFMWTRRKILSKELICRLVIGRSLRNSSNHTRRGASAVWLSFGLGNTLISLRFSYLSEPFVRKWMAGLRNARSRNEPFPKPMAVSANATVLIGPEQSIEYHFNLARLFDLSRTGVYQVSASRTVAPWAFNLPAPVAGQPATPKQADLILKPISFHMTEDAVSISGPASAPSPTHQTFLYMTGQEGNGVSRYRVGNDGDVSFAFPPANPDPVPPAKEGFHSITATPDGHFLYVSNGGDSTVSQFRIGDDGVLLPLSPPTVPAHPFPSYPSPLLMDPKGRFLYHLAGTLYTIGTDGRLTVTASVSNDPPPPNSSPQAPAHNYNVTASANGAIDSTGTFLYTSLGQTRGYRLAPNGGLAALPLPVGLASEENRANDMAFALAPSGKFAYVGESATLSNAYFDQIVTMRVAPDGTLSAVPGVTTPKAPPSQWPNQTRPDCLALSVDPSGRFLVVVNPQYLACYRIGADGSLASLGAKQVGSDFTSVFFGSGGAVLYALNRDPAPLMAFRLDDRQGLVPAGVDLPSGLLSANFIAAVSAPTPLKWGSASGGFTISASLSGDVLPAAAPVVLTVAVKNVTSSPIFLGMSGAEMTSFHLSMSGPQRQSPGILRGVGEPAAASVPLLAAGHDLFDAPGKGGTELVIPPGQQRQYRFVLSRLADLTVAGNYTVQITRTLPGGAEVASPVVSFLLDGPYNGLTRGNFWQGVSVL